MARKPCLCKLRRHVQDDKTTGPVYDLLGRKLSSIPSKGIYIQNGRKYVVR